MGKLTRFGVSLDSHLLDKFDKEIKKKMYSNRSEAIRDLIRNFLLEGKWEEGEEEVTACLTIVYDHDVGEITHKLLDVQHEELAKVGPTMHAHLDERNCMEATILRGKPQEIQQVADRLISLRGVKHGKLVKGIVERKRAE